MSFARYAAVVVAGLATTLLPAIWLLGPRLGAGGRWAMAYGGGLAGLNTLAAYALVVWSGRRSQQAFLAAVLGGMVGRMAAMLGLTVVGVLALGLPRLPLAFTLLGYFVLFLAFEIAVLQRRTTSAETR